MSDRSILDDEDGLRKIDRSGMVDMISNLPDDMSGLLSGPAPEPPSGEGIGNVVFSGMGGSAIGGDIIRSWLGPRMKVPVLVNRGYDIPPFADQRTLFVTVSFSGNTEETISSFEKAVERGCRVVALSTGGRLEQLAKDAGVHHHRITAPDGMVPRAALGLMLVPIAQMIEGTGLVEGTNEELEEVIGLLRNKKDMLGPLVPFDKNESKALADGLQGTIPVVTGMGMLEVAALRWKCQLNENAKVIAWADALPEMDHNTIVGWSGDTMARGHSAIILRDERSEGSEVRLRNRIEATKEAAWKKGAAKVMEVWTEGTGPIARIMSAIYKGDFTSLYLAVLRGIDPTPVEIIESLKAKLKEMGG